MKLKNLVKTALLVLPLLSNASEKKFSSSDSVTINLNSGNSDLKTYILESKNKYKAQTRTYSLNGKYSYGESNDEITVDNWKVSLGVEQIINKKLSAFLRQGLESDLIADIKYRSNSDIGLKYYFSKTDKREIDIDLGFRYTVEEQSYSQDKEKFNKGNIRLSYLTELDKKVKIESFFEYLPNFTESEDYQMNANIALVTKLISLLSVKTSLDWKFDNLPAANTKKDDYALTLSFIADF